MEVLTFPGGMYCDCIPAKEYAVLIPTAGIVKSPGGDLPVQNNQQPYYLRLKNSGDYEFVGQNNNGFDTLIFRNGGWGNIPQTPCGKNPVIYKNDGTLLISDCSVGVQGYRYVDYETGVVYSGDATTYLPAGQIYEYCYIGRGMYIGQGNVGDAILWDGTNRRLLYKGAPYTIKFNRTGDDVAISFYLDNGSGVPPTAILVWATLDELANLPIVGQDDWKDISTKVQRRGDGGRLVDLSDGSFIDLGQFQK